MLEVIERGAARRGPSGTAAFRARRLAHGAVLERSLPGLFCCFWA